MRKIPICKTYTAKALPGKIFGRVSIDARIVGRYKNKYNILECPFCGSLEKSVPKTENEIKEDIKNMDSSMPYGWCFQAKVMPGQNKGSLILTPKFVMNKKCNTLAACPLCEYIGIVDVKK